MRYKKLSQTRAQKKRLVFWQGFENFMSSERKWSVESIKIRGTWRAFLGMPGTSRWIQGLMNLKIMNISEHGIGRLWKLIVHLSVGLWGRTQSFVCGLGGAASLIQHLFAITRPRHNVKQCVSLFLGRNFSSPHQICISSHYALLITRESWVRMGWRVFKGFRLVLFIPPFSPPSDPLSTLFGFTPFGGASCIRGSRLALGRAS